MKEEKFEEFEKVDSEEYNCPSCNAPLSYNPSDSTLICEYCGYKEEVVGEASTVEYDLEESDFNEEEWDDETKLFVCSSCGAESVVSITEICHKCAFCGSNQITETDKLPGIKPHRVVNFRITSKEAEESYRKKIKRNIFVPSSVKKMNISLLSTGVYLPSWTFDAYTSSDYSGRLGKTYTKRIGSGKNARYVTRVRWYRISGIEEISFDDELINAGQKVTSSELARLEPFDTNNAFLYDKKYLANFVAEHYSLKVKDAWDVAQEKMKVVIKNKILSKYIYDRYGYLNIRTTYKNLKYKYVLIPIWIGVFNYKNKNYRYLVNGTNPNKIVAKLPLSGIKITFFVLGIVFAIILLILLLSLLYN